MGVLDKLFKCQKWKEKKNQSFLQNVMPWQGEFFSERLNVLQESGNLGLEVGVCFHESLEIPESRSGTVLLCLLGQLNTWRRNITRTKKMGKL